MSDTQFLEAEDFVIARLKAAFTAKTIKATVKQAADREDAKDRSTFGASAWVALIGWRPTGESQGLHVGIEQDIGVYITARAGADTTGIKAEAGPVIDAALAALVGWKPAGGWSGLKLKEGQPDYEAGFGMYAFTFSTRGAFTGEK